MKKIIAIILALVSFAFLFASCGGKKELVCDNCGKAVFVDMDSPMTDEWRIYCKDCEKALGLESVVPDDSYVPADLADAVKAAEKANAAEE